MQIVSKGLTYTYNPKTEFKVEALNGVDLIISEGDFFGVIGQTGSGKSTFIQHLNGLIPVQNGALTVGEYDLSLGFKKNKKALKELRSKVGMVFQYPEYQLFAETVFEDVEYGLKNFCKKLSKEEIENAVRDALETVGLPYEKYAKRSPFELSGGQKRRVALAGVIVTKPEILVLDEPAAGLDPLGKEEIMSLLHKIHGDWCKTIIIVSHDMEEIAENCTRAAIFADGKVVSVDTPKWLFEKVEQMQELGLDVPFPARICKALSAEGIQIDCDYTVADFVAKTLEYVKTKGAGTRLNTDKGVASDA